MFRLQPAQLDEYRSAFREDGYLLLRRVVPMAPLEQLCQRLCAEFARAKNAGELFSGGGMISGHLNCFPGAGSRFVLDALVEAGVLDLVRALSPQAERLPNVGCNFNLPSSSAQNHHLDGYASQPFMIANVAAVTTSVSNGAMQLSAGSHKRDYKYWEFALARLPALQLELSPGDVLLRPSTHWHRGMPNRTRTPRPMLGFSWEEGGSPLGDPYSVHEGQIKFLPNRYGQSLSGQLRERAFASLPSLGAGYLFLRSLLQS